MNKNNKKDFIKKLIETFKKVWEWVKTHPLRAVAIIILIIALAIFIRIYISFILIAAIILMMFWDKIFPVKPKVNGSNAMHDCVFHAVLDLHDELKVLRPKILSELNPSEIINSAISFFVVKKHPNEVVDDNTLDEGRFLLDDKARHYSDNNNCVIHITSVKDEGGYIKIVAKFGDTPAISNPPATTPANNTFQDEDF
ncbi:MAG: hypothetical protein LBD23_01215 [Oscillospiraceae bacterium]|nr:hypothetical protein [Oscillospiraceae bacterium]